MATKYSSKLRGKRILVLGGTSGIGFCIAEALVEQGAVVIIASSRQAKVDATIEKLGHSYPDAKSRISGYVCDLGDAETIESNIIALYEAATSEGKDKLDHVANTAGDALTLPAFDQITVEHIHKSTQVRFNGSLFLGKHAKSYINSSASSSVTFTGGVNTYKPSKGWALQAGGGASVEGLARALAVELAPIRVNQVAPGAVLTELWGSLTEDALEKTKERFSKQLLTGALGKPEDVAEAYVYCMRDNFVTGQAILSDGGFVLT